MRTSTRLCAGLLVLSGIALLTATAPAQAASTPNPADDHISVTAGSGPVQVDVLANDTDPEATRLSVTAVSEGRMVGSTLVWHPRGFIGDHAITYTVSDGQQTADAHVFITVTAPLGLPPAPKPDQATVTTGSSVTIPVLDNDTDSDGDSLTITDVAEAPKHGSASTDGTSIIYDATSPFVGRDALTYAVSDGTQTSLGKVNVRVTSYDNNAPEATDDTARARWHRTVTVDVLQNDTDADGDTLVVSAVGSAKHGTAALTSAGVTYVPRTGFLGTDRFPYTVADGRGGEDTGNVTVTVQPSYDVTLTHPHHAVALRATTLAGRVSTKDGAKVAVTVQRAIGENKWRRVTTTRVRADRTFHKRWKPNTPGSQRLRAVAVWSNGHRDISPVLRLRINARFDPVVTKVTPKDVPHSWRRGCPVGPSSLRKIQLNYWDYQKRIQRGTLIGAAWAVNDYKYFFKRAFNTKFQIKKMIPVDRWGGSDKRAMRAGDTSAFNCRHVTGNPYRISQHSYGDAIDINTFENPYVTGSHVYPPAATVPYYRNRDKNLRDPGVITHRSSIARAMFSRGWLWGARWANPDFQHWSMNGG